MNRYIFKIEYWNDFLSINDTKQIVIECKYFIDAWQIAYEKAIFEFGEDLVGIIFLRHDIPF